MEGSRYSPLAPLIPLKTMGSSDMISSLFYRGCTAAPTLRGPSGRTRRSGCREIGAGSPIPLAGKKLIPFVQRQVSAGDVTGPAAPGRDIDVPEGSRPLPIHRGQLPRVGPEG